MSKYRTCGLTNFEKGSLLDSDGSQTVSARIFNGVRTDQTHLPWQVKLIGPGVCGGTLVSMKVKIFFELLGSYYEA